MHKVNWIDMQNLNLDYIKLWFYVNHTMVRSFTQDYASDSHLAGLALGNYSKANVITDLFIFMRLLEGKWYLLSFSYSSCRHI